MWVTATEAAGRYVLIDGYARARALRALGREYQSRQDRFMEYRIARAHLPERWTLDTYPWALQPGIRRAQLLQLASLDFIARAENLVLVGPTGVGKTGLASALLLRALHAGYR